MGKYSLMWPDYGKISIRILPFGEGTEVIGKSALLTLLGVLPDSHVSTFSDAILSIGENFRCWTVTRVEARVTYRLTIFRMV